MEGINAHGDKPDGDELWRVCQFAYHAARRVGQSPFDADDTSQDTALRFMGSWERLGHGQTSALPIWSGYVGRSARNCIKDAARGSTRRRMREELADSNAASSSSRHRPSTVRPGTIRPGAEVEGAVGDEFDLVVSRMAVIRASGCLPCKQRELVLDILESGYSVAQISEREGVSVAAINGRLRRAINSLREQLDVDD